MKKIAKYFIFLFSFYSRNHILKRRKKQAIVMNNHQKKPLNTFLLTGICISTILSIRNWPVSAEYGLSSLLLLLAAAFAFLIPVSLVAAELATGWPQKGGIFVWVKEAFGYKMGLLSIWFVWISNVVWYPTILSFIGAAIGYTFFPRFANNPWILSLVVILCFWSIILLNLRGMKISGMISSLCLILGTIVPGLLIISFGIFWIGGGETPQIALNLKSIIPKFSGVEEIVFFAGLLLGFAGMEMPAVHANDVKNPQKGYPRAIFLSVIVIILLSIFGTFAVGVMIPKDQISFITAPLDVIVLFLGKYHLSFFVPILTFLIGLGAFGGVSTWVVGPSRGLLEAAQGSHLPSFITAENRKGMPVGILVTQGVVVTFLSLLYIVMPNLNIAFWILTALAVQLYLIAYVMMFIAGIYLRYKRADVERKYRIPFANVGMWVIGSIGIIASIFSFCIGFFPPGQLEAGNKLFYFAFLIIGIILFVTLPLFVRVRSVKEPHH